MIIDKSPIISGNTFTTLYPIDDSEDVSIAVNGLLTFLPEDFLSISEYNIELLSSISLDYDDDYVIFYTKK